jgi:3-hydroxybutyryl-CoA dehydrogenase
MIDINARDFVLGVVGAGAMGSGIAQVALTGGLAVRLTDASEAQLEKARATLFQRLDRLAEKGEARPDQIAAAKARLMPVAAVSELAPCAIVIEAIVENLDAKRTLFRALEDVLLEHAIIASNTSSIPIAAIAQACRHRRRVAGMHFFNPVPLMRLVEIIASTDTDPEVAAVLAELGRRMGRTPVTVKDAPGFLVNLGGRAYYPGGAAPAAGECRHARGYRSRHARMLRLPHGAVRAARSHRHRRQLSRQRDRA